jgi:hypothetical protein
MDGKLLENNPFQNVEWKENYFLAVLFCVEKDSVTLMSYQ